MEDKTQNIEIREALNIPKHFKKDSQIQNRGDEPVQYMETTLGSSGTADDTLCFCLINLAMNSARWFTFGAHFKSSELPIELNGTFLINSCFSLNSSSLRLLYVLFAADLYLCFRFLIEIPLYSKGTW